MDTSNTKSAIMNLAYVEHMRFLQKLRQDKELSVDDLDTILMKSLLDIKVEKESSLSVNVLNLTYQLQQMEEEKKKIAQDQAMQVKEEKKEE